MVNTLISLIQLKGKPYEIQYFLLKSNTFVPFFHSNVSDSSVIFHSLQRLDECDLQNGMFKINVKVKLTLQSKASISYWYSWIKTYFSRHLWHVYGLFLHQIKPNFCWYEHDIKENFLICIALQKHLFRNQKSVSIRRVLSNIIDSDFTQIKLLFQFVRLLNEQ